MVRVTPSPDTLSPNICLCREFVDNIVAYWYSRATAEEMLFLLNLKMWTKERVYAAIG